jgi:hypothetical protein
LLVSAFDIVSVRDALGTQLTDKGWRGKSAVFNLTGGTKTMAFAAYELAVRLGSDFLYFQTEGIQSLVYRYTTSGGAPTLSGPPHNVGPLLTIDDYLRVYVGNYSVNSFSPTIVDECLAGIRFSPTVEVDFVIRCGNQVGVVEVKTGRPGKEGIDQLTAVCGREYLGIYTKRLLISARSWENLDELRDLASARGVELIELPSYQENGAISEDDINVLQRGVRSSLRCS